MLDRPNFEVADSYKKSSQWNLSFQSSIVVDATPTEGKNSVDPSAVEGGRDRSRPADK